MFKRGDVVRFRSGGYPMTVVKSEAIRADGTLTNLILVWQNKDGSACTAQDVPDDCVEPCEPWRPTP